MLPPSHSLQRYLPESALRLVLALLIPLVAAELQWIIWGLINPYIWFLFYPAVFFSSWVDGRRGGMLATLLSASLAVFVFEPPISPGARPTPACGSPSPPSS